MRKVKKDKKEDIHIDYDHIDVEKIMEQIRKKIDSRPPETEPSPHMTTENAGTPSFIPPEPEGPPGVKTKVKNVLLKIMKPVSPLIKFMVLPVHQEVREIHEKLYRTDKHLEFLGQKHDQLYRAVTQRINDVDKAVSTRLDLAYQDLNRAKEYIRLLHNLTHNLVVELTKLKIEEENLKIKARIIEKDFEFLGRREKAVEKKVFQ